MTDYERRLALALSPSRVRYLPATWDKRFARDLAAIAEGEAPLITAKQRECLLKLGWKYRRQHRIPVFDPRSEQGALSLA